MPVTVASQSIHLSDEMAKSHEVVFFVYTKLAAASFDDLKPHLPEHLTFLKRLEVNGQLTMAGPFYTVEGKNSGDGAYVLHVDSLDEAQRIAAKDPLHELGLRTPTVQPWVKNAE